MTVELNAAVGNVESKKDVLVKDMKTVVGDTNVLLRGIAAATADGYAATRSNVEGRLDDARTRLEATRTQMADRAHGLAEASQAYVKENPWKIVGASAAVGLVVGYFLSRR